MIGNEARRMSATAKAVRPSGLTSLDRGGRCRGHRVRRAAALAVAAALAILLFTPGAALALSGGPEIPVAIEDPGGILPFGTGGYSPVIAPDSGGGLSVAWQSWGLEGFREGGDGDGYGVVVRRLDAADAPLSGEIAVNTTTTDQQWEPAIASDPGGGFTVAWTSGDEYYTPSSGDIYARRFDAAGAPLGGEIPVNETTAGYQDSPAIAPDPGGGFTVAWMSSGDVYARRFDSAGQPLGGEIDVGTGGWQTPAIASSPGGGLTVAWSTGHNIYARRFDAAGAPLGGEIPVNTTRADERWYPAIASDPGGGFTVAWQSYEQDGSGYGVYARRFDAAGAPLSGEIAVNTTTADYQWYPAIASDPGGGFTVAWQSYGQDGSNWGVYARRFDAAGAPLDGKIPEIAISTAVDSDSAPAIAPDGEGGFTVVWGRILAGGYDDGIYARRFVAEPPPNTSIDFGPSGPTSDPTPTIGFSSNEPASSFECKLDGGGFQPCSPPHTTADLNDGSHFFEVRAVDPDGRDPTPASRSFTVDTKPPGTQIDSGPTNGAMTSAGNATTSAASPPLAALPPDTVPPNAKLFGNRRQKGGKPIEIKVSCAEDCALLATGRVVVWGAPHRGARAARRAKARFGLRKAARQLSAGQVATLRLRPKSRKARRRLRRLVRRGRKARARIRVAYRDRAGNAGTARLTIRLRSG